MAQKRYAAFVLLLASIAGLIFGLGLSKIYLLHVGHDQSWCVYAAYLELHGAQLNGPQIVEVNPPFIVWFSAISVLLGELLHIGILDGFRLFFDLLVLASLLWTTSLLIRLLRLGAISTWLFVMAQSVVALWLMNKNSLGQREQLLVLIILPYLVLAAARLRDKSTATLESILIGLSAAIAICLKPQHILVVALVETLILFRRRSPRTLLHPAVPAFAVGIIGYLLSVVLFGRTYLANVVPQLRMVYWAMNHSYYVILRPHAPIFLGLILCWIIFLLFRRRLRLQELSLVFGVSAIGSALAYIQQHKGWNYQIIPTAMFAVLFITTVCIGAVEAWFDRDTPADAPSQRSLGQAIALASVCAFCALLLGLRFGHHPGYNEPEKQVAANFYQSAAPGSAVSYISVNPWELPVFIEQNKVLGQRINYFWLLPAIIYGQDPQGNELNHTMPASQIEELSLYQRRTMAEDLAHWKPSVVIVDQCGPNVCDSLKREHYGTLLNWFLADPGFQREWQHYQLAEKKGDLESFHRID